MTLHEIKIHFTPVDRTIKKPYGFVGAGAKSRCTPPETEKNGFVHPGKTCSVVTPVQKKRVNS